MKLWENLSHDLNYNVMFSQRGMPQPRAHARRSSTTMSAAAMPCAIAASMPS